MIRWLANCMSVVFVCDNCLLRGEKNKQRAILITSDFYLKQTATQKTNGMIKITCKSWKQNACMLIIQYHVWTAPDSIAQAHTQSGTYVECAYSFEHSIILSHMHSIYRQCDSANYLTALQFSCVNRNWRGMYIKWNYSYQRAHWNMNYKYNFI